MALVTAQGISSLLVPLLRRTLVLPNTISRVSGAEFSGPNGSTITIRVRQPRTANVQAVAGAAISYTSVDETGVDVSVVHIYDGVSVTDQELSLELVDFAVQVTEPQVAAVATGIEDEVAGAMNDVAADATDLASGNVDDYFKEARQTLSEADVPLGDRFAAATPAATTLLLGLDNFEVNLPASGDASALREAVIGRYRGFNVVESNGLTGGDNDEAIVFYHRSGFGYTQRPPVSPRGAAQSASVTDSGFGMRQIFDYDADTATDRSLISSFAGAALADADRVFKVEDATA